MLDKFNTNLVEENDHLLLAVSGGIDSMVMLHYLNELKKNKNFQISVAHFNHHKRLDSDNDQHLVEKTCNSYGIDCHIEHLDKQDYDNFHDHARQKRYDFFYHTAKKIKANKIVLAHNQNDHAETIIMRIVRGSSFEGYRGILSHSNYKDLAIIRPFLGVSREDIRAYQSFFNVEYYEDSSNQQDDYTRNRFRHNILPLFQKENPKYLEKFEQFSTYQTKAYKLIEKLAVEYIENEVKTNKESLIIDANTYCKLDEIIQIEVAKRIVNIKTDNQLELTFQNISDIIELIQNEKPHLELILNENLYISKSYNFISFANKKTKPTGYEFVIAEEQELKLPNGALVIITKNPNKYYGIMFKLCYNNLDFIFPLTLRNRRNGDKISTKAGTKKIKDVFINKKVPMQLRNELPVLLNKNNEIIWIPSVFKAECSGDKYLYIIYQEGKRNA